MHHNYTKLANDESGAILTLRLHGWSSYFPHRFTWKPILFFSLVAQSSKDYCIASSRCLGMWPHGLVRRRGPMAFQVAPHHELSIFVSAYGASLRSELGAGLGIISYEAAFASASKSGSLRNRRVAREYPVISFLGNWGICVLPSDQCDCFNPRAENFISATLPICNDDFSP